MSHDGEGRTEVVVIIDGLSLDEVDGEVGVALDHRPVGVVPPWGGVCACLLASPLAAGIFM